MDGIVNQDLDLLAPYRQSFAYDDTEQALQSLFIDLFEELFADQIKNIHHYGMPHLGSATVVERFTKQDGLAVLRRPTSSDVIMRVIYANWLALASRRGLAFLEFVLQMIWEDQWKIERLYHTKDRLNVYPTLVTTQPTRNSFLTSRISITLDQDIDVEEIYEISPIISKLVPANVVATITSGLELGETYPLSLAAGLLPVMVGNFQLFEPLSSVLIPWTGWGVLKAYTLDHDTVRYNGYKTNMQQIYHTFATMNLRALALSVMSKPEYNQLDAVYDGVLGLYSTAISVEVDVANQRVMASIVGSDDKVNAAKVMIDRIILSENGVFVGSEYMPQMLQHFEWFYEDGAIRHTVPAHISKRSELVYTIDSIISYIGHLDAAQLHIADLVANNPDWLDYTLQDLDFIAEDTGQADYVQQYTILDYAENPTIPDPPLELVDDVTPFDDYVVESIVTVTGVMAAYKARKSNGTDMYYATADFDLTEAVTRSLSDADQQGLQLVKDVCDQLTGVTDWTFDNINLCVNFISPSTSNPETVAYLVIAEEIINCLESTDPDIVLLAEDYLEAVANSIFEADELKQFVLLTDIEPLFDASKVLIEKEIIAKQYAFAVAIESNPDFISVDATENVPVDQADLDNMFIVIREDVEDSENYALWRDLNYVIQSAYKKDDNYPTTNTLYSGSLIAVPFADVVNQIFANMLNNQLIYYVSAKEYLNKIAETVYLSNPADQLIKVSDLAAQFEANKVLKSII